MKKTIVTTGKTIDEAVMSALNELNISRDKVDVEVIDEGNKGFLGLFGVKLSKVKVTVKDNYSFEAKRFLSEVLNAMGIIAEVNIEEVQDSLKISLKGPNMGLLIGHRGETLDSLQYLVSLVINKKNTGSEYKRVVVDTENYRQKREETLVRLANRLAAKARTMNKSVVLEPMNPYERRVIHSALQNNPNITTHSIGEEPYRKVVIELKGK